jgi:hypothetical protein
VQRLPRHHYTLQDVQLFIELVLSGRAPLRCAGRVPQIVSQVCGLALGQPDWTSGRMWLLRLGLYKLTCPKTHADDWVWLIDHSVQSGTTKCLVILGVRLGDLPPAGEPLRHEHLEPIEVLPVENSTKEAVCEQLEAAAARTGVPRAILDDHGADLHGGVKLFQQQHPETLEIYDVTHKAARLLKHHQERDPRWTAFGQQVGKARRQIQQTELACLVPPPVGTRPALYCKRVKFACRAQISKSEARNPKQIPISKSRNLRNGWLRDVSAFVIRISNLFRISSFGFRIWLRPKAAPRTSMR